MVATQIYKLIRMRFLERIIAGIRKYEDRKNILECPQKLLPNLGALGYKYVS